MRHFIFPVLAFLIISATQQCASPGSPTGGPKDTIPPNLISSEPESGTINFDQNSITLTLDERVTAEKLKAQLQITPTTEIPFKSFVKKNIVTIEFEEPFEDSTTYTLNFRDGITDITEKNAVENLSMAFSTGPFIDSLSISGKVTDLFTQKPQKGFTVGLYQPNDSLDYNQQKPYYFFSTREDGTFEINNIKNGLYRVFAFKDNNGNILHDPKDEPFSFFLDTLNLQQATDSIHLKSIEQDISSFKMNSARPFGHYFEIRYSKEVKSFRLTNLSASDSIPLFQIVEQSTARIFNTIGLANEIDTVQLIATASDTLGNVLKDTLDVIFKDTNKKKTDFTFNSILSSKNLTAHTIHISSNKPILAFDPSKFYIPIDSSNSLSINSLKPIFQFQNNRLDLVITFYSDWSSLNDTIQTLTFDANDTVSTEPTDVKQLTIIGDTAALISADLDSSTSFTTTVRKQSLEDFGTINCLVTTQEPNFVLQLIDKQGQVIRESWNKSEVSFNFLTPGNYGIRVLIDSNNNGSWNAGNLYNNIPPEPVYLYSDMTNLRANFEITIDDISF
ncbi:MAG: Ig-like domain-containing protein [Cyclobacteriaceae bacterium]